MQSKSRPFDELGNLFTNAVGAVKGVGDELGSITRAQFERLIADMDLVARDEFEVTKDRLSAAEAEIEALQKKIKTLETQMRNVKKTLKD